MDWVDVGNLGVSHLGIHPTNLPCNSIRFDVFHLQCAITRRLMKNLHKFMLMQTVELIIKFLESVL